MRRYSLGMCNFPFRCEAFGNVQFSLWWVKPLLQTNGFPVQIEGSWVSLKGVLHMFKDLVWLKGVLHMCTEILWVSNKRTADSIFFLTSEAFRSNKWYSCPNRGQLGFFERSGAYVQRNGVKDSWASFERSTTSLKDTLHILKQYRCRCLTRSQL